MHEILIVEDDLENCDILARNFDKTGRYRHTIVHNAEEALLAVSQQDFELILLDIMLPGVSGIDLCIKLRESLYCPIIFMSCLDDEDTIVHAMRMGGDDYITKPFRVPVLLAHVEAMLRRMRQESSHAAENLMIGDMVLSTKEHVIKKNNEKILLSPTEFALLIYFIKNEGVVLRFEAIYEHIWKRPSLGDLRTVFSHIRNIRKKIEKDPSNPYYIVTVPRVGYIFSAKKVKEL